MRALEQALTDHELITLRVIGEWWDLELIGTDKAGCIRALTERLSQLDMTAEMEYLGREEAAALQELVQAGGRLPVGTFSRQHGEVRLMGPGRLEREEPWLDPTSAAEALWYRGFLYRAFDETGDGLVEFYYLPDELLASFDLSAEPPEEVQQELPAADAPDSFQPARSSAVDDLTTILAAAQKTPLPAGWVETLQPYLLNPDPARASLLLSLAVEMELLRKTKEGIRPARAAVNWLGLSREEALRQLADAWRESRWNELYRTPGIACEGSGWENDPALARAALLNAAPRSDEWFAVNDLLESIKSKNPDFQRPEGKYDAWYIRDLASDTYIAGFNNWDLVEGRQLRFLIQGPLYWLGLADVTGLAADVPSLLYRLTPRALAWLAQEAASSSEVTIPIVVQDDAAILVPYNADRRHRFQVARISQAEPVTEETAAGQPYVYRLTPASLEGAREQAISTERILQFLAESSGRPLPASTRRAIERWQEKGVEARLDRFVILRVKEAAILDTLRNNPKTRPYIGENLSDLAAIVRQDEWPQLRQAAAQLGLLLHCSIEKRET